MLPQARTPQSERTVSFVMAWSGMRYSVRDQPHRKNVSLQYRYTRCLLVTYSTCMAGRTITHAGIRLNPETQVEGVPCSSACAVELETPTGTLHRRNNKNAR